MTGFVKTDLMALTGVAQLVGHRPAKQKVTGSVPGQGTCLGYGFCLLSGSVREASKQAIHVSLSHQCFSFSFPSPLSENR